MNQPVRHPYEYPSWQERPEVPEPIGLSNWDGSLTARAAPEPSPIQSPTSGKNLFFFTPWE